MSPSVEPFNEAKYKALMDGLEISEVAFSSINLGDRYDAEYFTKKYLDIEQKLERVTTKKIGDLSTAVASAFYPAATQLYSIGDTAFVRCVDCIDFPIITSDQDARFEKIPYAFGKENNGISFLSKGEIVVTKVGTPCYASIVDDYEEVALSRTVMGLSNIHGIDAYYLMIFLRCKYGFVQLYRQRELTIQYQLTLPRVKAVNVYYPSDYFQKIIKQMCLKYRKMAMKSTEAYEKAERVLADSLGISTKPFDKTIAVKSFADSFLKSGRLDSEYYQPKYDALFDALKKIPCKLLGGYEGLTCFKKSIEPGSEAYQNEGIPFVRVSNISKYEIASPEIYLSNDVVRNVELLFPKKDTILFSKDGSVGIAYKLECDENIITSGALLHLTVRNTNEILPDYLTLVLNSPVVQMQAERDSNGAIIQHWKPSEIENVIIPVLDMAQQKEIAVKVQESFALRRKSKKLLEYAKQAVEMAIEQGEDAALVWLKANVPNLEV